mmetsp:Transcript_11066/g.21959  ORF Transcript_11066/g.21959 Transcript_11066/m.21959 type:complete len:149 (+) Transcript_11066:511-957(+)
MEGERKRLGKADTFIKNAQKRKKKKKKKKKKRQRKRRPETRNKRNYEIEPSNHKKWGRGGHRKGRRMEWQKHEAKDGRRTNECKSNQTTTKTNKQKNKKKEEDSGMQEGGLSNPSLNLCFFFIIIISSSRLRNKGVGVCCSFEKSTHM